MHFQGKPGTSDTGILVDRVPKAVRRYAKWFVGMLLVAISYAIAGWCGLMQIDPTLHGVNIWPAAGVASAMLILRGRRYWPGVLVGMGALHGVVASGVVPDVPATAAALVSWPAAVGAAAQAFIAATLVRRWAGTPIELRSIWTGMALLMLAGPVSCTISATFGVLALGHALPPTSPAWMLPWLKWWLGDSAGVLLALPLTIYFQIGRSGAVHWKDHDVPHATRAGTYLAIIGIVAASFISISVTNAKRVTTQELFDVAVGQAKNEIQQRLYAMSHVAERVADEISGSWGVTQGDWMRAVHGVNVEALPGFKDLGFIAAVTPPTQNPQLSSGLGQVNAGSLVASKREQMLLQYVAPDAVVRPLRSDNIGMVPVYRDAAEMARDRGQTTLSLVGNAPDQLGGATPIHYRLLLTPVYRAGLPIATVAERRAAIEGWVFVEIDDNQAFKVDHAGAAPVSLKVHIGDESHPTPVATLGVGGSTLDGSGHYKSITSFDLFGRHWTLDFQSTAWFETASRSHEGVIIFVGGILLTTFIAGLVSSLTQREQDVRNQVIRRTAALAVESGKLRTIIDNASVGILFVNEACQVRLANPAAVEIFEASIETLVGKNIKDLLPQLIQGEADSCADRWRNRQTIERLEFVSPSGRHRWLELRVSFCVDDNGSEIATLIFSDVTDAVASMRRVEIAERRWNAALEGSEIGVFEVDLQTQKGVASDSWKRLAGFKPEDDVDIEREWEARVHPDDLPRVRQADRDCIEGRTDRIAVEYRFRVVNGSWRWMRGEARIVERDQNGTALRLLGTMRDVTALKAALDLAEAREKKLNELIVNTPIPMAVFAADGHIQRVNDSFCTFTGYTRDELLQKSLFELPSESGLRHISEGRQKLISGEITSFVAEETFLHPDGSERIGLVNKTAYTGSAGEDQSYIAQIVDVTERERLARLQADFVATVSHELRTPLTSINGSIKLILGMMSKELSEKTRHLLVVAQQNCNRLGSLVNDLLDIQKLSAGAMDLEFEPVEIVGLVKECAAECAPFAMKYKVHLEFSASEDATEVMGDAFRLKQVITNLLSNAVKFSFEDHAVKLSVGSDNGEVVIMVTNVGRGISRDFADRIFQPFTQASDVSTRDREGTGLGLSISKALVERMHGQIGFESEPNAETTFWIRVPQILTGVRDVA